MSKIEKKPPKETLYVRISGTAIEWLDKRCEQTSKSRAIFVDELILKAKKLKL